jgi:hypothetical protein
MVSRAWWISFAASYAMKKFDHVAVVGATMNSSLAFK